MQKNTAAVPEESHFVLSSLAPGRAQKRLAAGVVLVLLVALYLITGPLSGVKLPAVNAFVAIYATAMFVTDSITAILLYAQFSILRSRAILVIASGYLFTALIVVPYVLSFPGVFAPNGVIGGLQTSAGLYVLWHCGFPIFVLAYALTKDEDPGKRVWQRDVSVATRWTVAATAVAAAAGASFCIVGERYLPPIMVNPMRFGPEWPYYVGAPVALLCTSAIVVLWLRRRSVLDLWLMVVMCLFLIEIPLSYYPMPSRFSTGWYAVRVVGFLSSSIVLIVLLYEITTLYGRLLGAVVGQRREREARLMTGDAVAASIAHELRQPLTAMVTTADAGLRFLDRSSPNMDKAKEAFKRIVGDGHRAGTLIGSIRAHFKSDVRERTAFSVNELVQETLDLTRGELQKNGILVQPQTDKDLPEVRGNRIQLQQVLLNLIMNAIDAMPMKDAAKILSIKANLHESGHVMISVADTGGGVSSKDAERLFNPLFTTKPDGMGMGLSICRAIVEAHEGQLWFAPNGARGAVFHFTLPADRADSVSPPDDASVDRSESRAGSQS
jgi:signal transduction histidine kinase